MNATSGSESFAQVHLLLQHSRSGKRGRCNKKRRVSAADAPLLLVLKDPVASLLAVSVYPGFGRMDGVLP